MASALQPTSRPPKAVTLTAFLAIASSMMLIPTFESILLGIRAEQGLSADHLSALSLLPIAGALVMTFVAAALTRRLGGRTVLSVAAVGLVIGALLCSVAPGLVVLLIGRVLTSMSATVTLVAGLSILQFHFTEPRARARVLPPAGQRAIPRG